VRYRVVMLIASKQMGCVMTVKNYVPLKLRPDEWRSGDILWLIDVIGDAKAMPSLLAQLAASGAFQGRPAKMRTMGKDGRVVVGLLESAGLEL
jgi:hypothetical protein